jgi:hypothetical protein
MSYFGEGQEIISTLLDVMNMATSPNREYGGATLTSFTAVPAYYYHVSLGFQILLFVDSRFDTM